MMRQSSQNYGGNQNKDLVRQVELLQAELMNAKQSGVELGLLLLRMHNELAREKSFDNLCRSAVELARNHLGFSRVGLWFVDADDPSVIRGSFGTDEHGNTRDERMLSYKLEYNAVGVEAWRKLREDQNPARPEGTIQHAALKNHLGEVIGEGIMCCAPVWEGRQVLGFISGDNLHSDRDLTQTDLDRLVVYGSMLGTLLAQKEAEERQQDVSERYAALFENAALGVVQYGIKNDTVAINSAAAAMFGFSDVQAALEQFQTVAPSLYAGPIPLDGLKTRLFQGAGKVRFEADLYRRDGSRWTANVYLSAVHDRHGAIDRIEGFFEDITERKEAERNSFVELGMGLLRAHDKLALAENVDDLCRSAVELARTHLGILRVGLWLYDKDDPYLMRGAFGTDESGNTRDERGLSYNTKDTDDKYAQWQTRSFQKQVFERPEGLIDRRPLRNHVHEIIGEGTILAAPVWSGERLLGIISADNIGGPEDLSQVDLDRLMLYGSMLGTLLAKKEAEQRQKETSERYAALFENSVLGIFQCSTSGRLLRINPAIARMLGCNSMEEAYATVTNIADSYTGHVPLRDLLSKLYASGSTERVEAQLRRKDGSPWTANLYLRAVTDSQGNIAYIEGFVEDITERKRAAEERLALERQVQHAQKLESLGVLASGIAHDFNNILMAVLGYADLAKSELPAQHPARQSLSEIEKGAIRAAELTRQMLAYSGKGHFVIEVMDVSRLINEMVDLLRTSISRSISLNVQLARDLPPIKADAGQIQQIVLNLITNASEAIGDQPGVITVSTGQALCSQEHLAHSLTNITSEDAPPPGRYVYFQVTDTGCGMDDDTKLRVFDPFFTTKFTGRGLGMAAVLGIVRGHNGAIMLETKPGIGTTFKVFFPAAPEKQVDCRQRPTKRPEMPQSKQGTILVIDDEIAVRNLTEKVLTRQGYSVLLAEDGLQGTVLFEEHADNIVCVLLDLTMPNMGGEACFDQLQSIRANIPVLLSSGYSEQTAIKQFSGKHIAGFIQKPYQPMKLVAKIRECIES